jgi:hypothetical protein
LQQMKRDGTSPKIEIVLALDEAHALFLERCLIAVIGRKDLGKGPLLNLTDGGEGLANPSETIRAKISKAKTGKCLSVDHRGKISEANRTRRATSETKAKMSAARKGVSRPDISALFKGVPLSEEHRKNLSGPKTEEHRAKIAAARRAYWSKRREDAISISRDNN